MSIISRAEDLVVGLRRASGPQLIARAVVALGSAVAFLAPSIEAGEVLMPVAVLVGVLTVACALQPDSHSGLLLLLVLVWHWAGVVDDHRTPWVVVAAVGLLLLHAAMALAATAPISARWTAPTLARWARRTATVAGMTVLAWAATVLVHAMDVDGGATLLVLAVVLLAASAAALRARSLGGG